MTEVVADLYSDTQTRPTDGMRAAMAAAEVGDEQLGADPTTCRLEARMADLLGTDTAVFLPSGTMANLVSVLSHARPGESAVVDARAHIMRMESGGLSALGGVVTEPVQTARGIFTADDLRAAIGPSSVKTPRTALVCLEQTHNLAGGTVWPLATWSDVCDAARAAGAVVHVDGARLFNAVAATGVDAHRWAAGADSIWVDFSKGLGAPMGAVLAGSAAFVEQATHMKHRVGGAMRQSGVAAAACLYALDHHVDRLADDHANAARLADGLAALGAAVERPVETNIVFFSVVSAGWETSEFVAAARARGVTLSPLGDRVRALTHIDVPDDAVDAALDVFGALLSRA